MRPSNRLLRAVAAERAALERQRGRLAEEARDLRAALARIEAGMAEIDERRGLLDRLAPPEVTQGAEAARGEREAAMGSGEAARGAREAGAGGGEAARGRREAAMGSGEVVPGARETRARSGGAGRGADGVRARAGVAVLRGPAIREAAVRVLVRHGEDSLHYREWFARLEGAGYAVAGKDPLAVFLTQLSRSPAVRKGPRAGVYELDRNAAERARRTLAALHRELAALTKTHDLQAIRARRAQLTAEIDRTEKALEEIARTTLAETHEPAAAII